MTSPAVLEREEEDPNRDACGAPKQRARAADIRAVSGLGVKLSTRRSYCAGAATATARGAEQSCVGTPGAIEARASAGSGRVLVGRQHAAEAEVEARAATSDAHGADGDHRSLGRPLDHFGAYVICWPPSAASAITPAVGLTKTAIPSTNRAAAAAPVFATTADMLAPKSS
jgi:hypothetical protein